MVLNNCRDQTQMTQGKSGSTTIQITSKKFCAIMERQGL